MQFLMNSACVEQPVLGREHSGPALISRRDKKGRDAQRPTSNRTESGRFCLERFSWKGLFWWAGKADSSYIQSM